MRKRNTCRQLSFLKPTTNSTWRQVSVSAVHAQTAQTTKTAYR